MTQAGAQRGGGANGAFPPGHRLTLADGSTVITDGLLASGGQGFVHSLRDKRDLVFKQIKPEVLADTGVLLERRLSVMTQRPPGTRREMSSGHVMLAWPTQSGMDGGRFVGFSMPRIDAKNAIELHMASNPSDRRDPAPSTPGWVRGFTWKYLLQIASNLALATDVLHRTDVVIGDFNERNILVTSNALVTLIDCDSMQITSSGGESFLCEVGREEFTAPELFGVDLRSVPRRPSSDLFPLAVHIHQLLLEGAHPFDGIWNRQGDKPKRSRLARQGLYVYAGDPKLSPPRSAPDYQALPEDVRKLFRRAFVDGAKDPSLRPTGADWHQVWTALQRT